MKLSLRDFVSTISATAVLAGANACSTNATQPMVEGELIVPLVALLVRPDLLPSGQQVVVSGYFAKGFGPLLFLTAEHAEAFDTSAAIPVSDPTEDGSLTRADCFDRFVAVSGTFVRHESGEVTIQQTKKVQYRSAPAAESKDWAHLYVTCWRMPAAAQHLSGPRLSIGYDVP